MGRATLVDTNVKGTYGNSRNAVGQKGLVPVYDYARTLGFKLQSPLVHFQQLYQTLTDYDIRFYLYELLKVSSASSLLRSFCGAH